MLWMRGWRSHLNKVWFSCAIVAGLSQHEPAMAAQLPSSLLQKRRGQRRPAEASGGQQRPSEASRGQRRPAEASGGQQGEPPKLAAWPGQAGPVPRTESRSELESVLRLLGDNEAASVGFLGFSSSFPSFPVAALGSFILTS